jgi:succinoglycan biosynthesis transport protein ExoP
VDVHDYARILRRNIVLIIATTLIGLAAGAANALVTPARYEASTQLFVAASSPTSSSNNDLRQGTEYARQAVLSYVDVISSALVLQPVIDDLGLEETVDELAERVSATANLNTVVITIRVEDDRPDGAARVADAVSDSFTAVVAEELERPTGDRVSPVRIETLQPATVPTDPSAPNVRLALAVGTLLGLAVGIAIAVLRTVLDTRVRTVEDVERTVPAPLLGGIALDPTSKKQPLIVAEASRHPRAEAFRALRTNVQFLSTGGRQTLVLTSANAGEGKSTTAANLALAFAETGARTVLVDADLRRPRMADYFGVEGGVGLSDVLIGRVGVSEVLQQWAQGSLFLLPAGAVPPNPAEMLGSPAMEALMLQLRAAFDVVIFDAPPVLAVTDAAVIGRAVDAVLLVAAAGSTRRSQLESAVQNIETAGSRVSGTVVTMLPTAGADKTSYGVYAYIEGARR